MKNMENQERREISEKKQLKDFYTAIKSIKDVLKDDNEDFNRKYKYFQDNKWYFKIRTFHLIHLIKQHKEEFEKYIQLSNEKLFEELSTIKIKLSTLRNNHKKDILKISEIF